MSIERRFKEIYQFHDTIWSLRIHRGPDGNDYKCNTFLTFHRAQAGEAWIVVQTYCNHFNEVPESGCGVDGADS